MESFVSGLSWAYSWDHDPRFGWGIVEANQFLSLLCISLLIKSLKIDQFHFSFVVCRIWMMVMFGRMRSCSLPHQWSFAVPSLSLIFMTRIPSNYNKFQREIFANDPKCRNARTNLRYFVKCKLKFQRKSSHEADAFNRSLVAFKTKQMTEQSWQHARRHLQSCHALNVKFTVIKLNHSWLESWWLQSKFMILINFYETRQRYKERANITMEQFPFGC